jgi:hypothetical protein
MSRATKTFIAPEEIDQILRPDTGFKYLSENPEIQFNRLEDLNLMALYKVVEAFNLQVKIKDYKKKSKPVLIKEIREKARFVEPFLRKYPELAHGVPFTKIEDMTVPQLHALIQKYNAESVIKGYKKLSKEQRIKELQQRLPHLQTDPDTHIKIVKDAFGVPSLIKNKFTNKYEMNPDFHNIDPKTGEPTLSPQEEKALERYVAIYNPGAGRKGVGGVAKGGAEKRLLKPVVERTEEGPGNFLIVKQQTMAPIKPKPTEEYKVVLPPPPIQEPPTQEEGVYSNLDEALLNNKTKHRVTGDRDIEFENSLINPWDVYYDEDPTVDSEDYYDPIENANAAQFLFGLTGVLFTSGSAELGSPEETGGIAKRVGYNATYMEFKVSFITDMGQMEMKNFGGVSFITPQNTNEPGEADMMEGNYFGTRAPFFYLRARQPGLPFVNVLWERLTPQITKMPGALSWSAVDAISEDADGRTMFIKTFPLTDVGKVIYIEEKPDELPTTHDLSFKGLENTVVATKRDMVETDIQLVDKSDVLSFLKGRYRNTLENIIEVGLETEGNTEEDVINEIADTLTELLYNVRESYDYKGAKGNGMYFSFNGLRAHHHLRLFFRNINSGGFSDIGEEIFTYDTENDGQDDEELEKLLEGHPVGFKPVTNSDAEDEMGEAFDVDDDGTFYIDTDDSEKDSDGDEVYKLYHTSKGLQAGDDIGSVEVAQVNEGVYD